MKRRICIAVLVLGTVLVAVSLVIPFWGMWDTDIIGGADFPSWLLGFRISGAEYLAWLGALLTISGAAGLLIQKK